MNFDFVCVRCFDSSFAISYYKESVMVSKHGSWFRRRFNQSVAILPCFGWCLMINYDPDFHLVGVLLFSSKFIRLSFNAICNEILTKL